MGFTQTYSWTKEPLFLHAAVECSRYFIRRLEESKSFVPAWDFDAPIDGERQTPLRDSSAGMIAVNGFLLLHQILIGEHRAEEAKVFFDVAVRIMRDTMELALANEKACFEVDGESLGVRNVVGGRHFDGILKHATANYNEDAHKRYWDSGLVYADYYFLEAGNKLMRMALL